MLCALRRTALAPVALTMVLASLSHAGELPSPLRLDELLAAVRLHNPDLAERQRNYAAAAARPAAERWPEDPMLMLEWWQQPIDFATVPIMLTVRQKIPWRSRLRLRRKLGEREASIARDEADEVERRIEADAKRAYFDMATAERYLEINASIRTLLADLVKIVDARYRVGAAVQADLFKAQAELLVTEDERLDLERAKDDAIARLNGLLDRSAGDSLGPTATDPKVPSLPAASELLARALANRPEIRRAKDALAAAQTRRGLATREALPELTAWAGYMVNVRGTDTFTVGVQTSLPIFSSLRTRALVGAADAEVEANRAALSAATRRTDVELRTVLLQLETAARHVTLHTDKLIPLSEVTLKSAMAAYEAGRVDFPSVLEAARMLREHHNNHIKFLFEYQRLLATLEQIVGEDLARGGSR